MLIRSRANIAWRDKSNISRKLKLVAFGTTRYDRTLNSFLIAVLIFIVVAKEIRALYLGIHCGLGCDVQSHPDRSSTAEKVWQPASVHET
jgi:hypothetical protein